MGSKKTSKKRCASSKAQSPSKAVKTLHQQSPAASSQAPRDSSYPEPSYTHLLPTSEQKKSNGRRAGRSLIMWNRPRMAEKVLLHLHYECARHKVQVPWDAVAHRLRPGSSGAAILQHLNRLRRDLIAEGHLVPPVAQKTNAGPPHDATIRGYVRADMTGDDRETTRAVRYDEKLEDPRFSLPDGFVSDENEAREEGELGGAPILDEDDGTATRGENVDEDRDDANILRPSIIAHQRDPSHRLCARPIQTAQYVDAAGEFLAQQAETLFDFDEATSFEDMSSSSFILGHSDESHTRSFESVQSSQSLQDAFDGCTTPSTAEQPGVDDESPEFGLSAAAVRAFLRPSAWDAPASAASIAAIPSTPTRDEQGSTPTSARTKVEPHADREPLAAIGSPNTIDTVHDAALGYPPESFSLSSAEPSTPTIGQAAFNGANASNAHALGGMMFPQTVLVLGPGGVMMPMAMPMHLSCGYNAMSHGQYPSMARPQHHMPSFSGAVPGVNINAGVAGQGFEQNNFNFLRAAAAAAAMGVDVQMFNTQGLNSLLRSMQPQTERVTPASSQNSPVTPVHRGPSATAKPSSSVSPFPPLPLSFEQYGFGFELDLGTLMDARADEPITYFDDCLRGADDFYYRGGDPVLLVA